MYFKYTFKAAPPAIRAKANMSTLLTLEEPAADGAARPNWRAFTEMGFRPLY